MEPNQSLQNPVHPKRDKGQITWKFRNTAHELFKEEIQQAAKVAKGKRREGDTKQPVDAYETRRALTNKIQSLTEEERSRVEDTMIQWNEHGPPREVQKRSEY